MQGPVFFLAVTAMRDEDDKPFTFRRALRSPEYWLLLVASLAAVGGVAWWIVVPLATAGLCISSLPKYVELWPRVRAAGAEWEGWKTVALSIFNSMAASCAAFVFGIVTRWLWFG
jgi:hypothetical protein